MTPATMLLHRTIIRHLKGIITAWEAWLSKQEERSAEAELGSNTKT